MRLDKKLILIVDDAITNLKNAEAVLKDKYNLALAKSGKQALEFMQKNVPDLILLDVLMPDMNGFEVMEIINNNEDLSKIPVIFLTIDHSMETEIKGFELGAQDFITKPFVAETMICRIERILELDTLRKNLEAEVDKKTKQVEAVTLRMLTYIVEIVDRKNKYTDRHSINTAEYAEEIARRLGMPEDEILELYYKAVLHDIGMISVPDSIINKKGPLDDKEWAIVKKHIAVGYDMLKDLTMYNNITEGILYHQEKYNGGGYPKGFVGDEIPLAGRIIALASAFDAMNSDRVYRTKLTKDEIHNELLSESGKQFDPALVEIMLGMMADKFEPSHKTGIAELEDNEDIVSMSGALLHKVLSEYTEEKKNEALKDPLTNIWNRQYAETNINEYLANGDKYGLLLMFDIDNFKYINDTFGHIVGDKLLIKIAQMLEKSTRKDDIICRLGGDEFIVFIKDVSSTKIIESKTEDIFEKVSLGLRSVLGDEMATISLGVAVAPKDGDNFTSLYNNADKSLYFVKQNGKGKLHYYSTAVEGTLNQSNVSTNGLDSLKNIACNSNIQKGAYHVEYSGFKNIYEFVGRYITRLDEQAQVMLFTLIDKLDDTYTSEEFMDSFETLRKSIQFQLRRGDVFTNYSDNQYIVILMNTDTDIGVNVANRVIKKYLEENKNENVVIQYDIKSLNADS